MYVVGISILIPDTHVPQFLILERDRSFPRDMISLSELLQASYLLQELSQLLQVPYYKNKDSKNMKNLLCTYYTDQSSSISCLYFSFKALSNVDHQYSTFIGTFKCIHHTLVLIGTISCTKRQDDSTLYFV